MTAKQAFHHGILAACLLGAIAACGDDDSSGAADSGPSKGHHKPTTKPDDAGTPDAGAPTAQDAMAADSAAPEPGLPTFDGVFQDVIMGGGCNAGPLCHGGSAGMLRMSDRDSAYEGLVGVKAKGMNLADTTGANCADTDLVRVVPKDPENSLLMQKIDPPAGKVPCGTIMPPIGELTAAQIEQVRTWIELGANDD